MGCCQFCYIVVLPNKNKKGHLSSLTCLSSLQFQLFAMLYQVSQMFTLGRKCRQMPICPIFFLHLCECKLLNQYLALEKPRGSFGVHALKLYVEWLLCSLVVLQHVAVPFLKAFPYFGTVDLRCTALRRSSFLAVSLFSRLMFTEGNPLKTYSRVDFSQEVQLDLRFSTQEGEVVMPPTAKAYCLLPA